MKFFKILILFFLILNLSLLNSCIKFKKVDQRTMPDGAAAKARKNIEEGKGAGLSSILGRGIGGTNYEFSTSNPMWRASLEILDFLPLTTVDYSGGIIITDWYSENNSDESIKISIRFLSNEVRADNLKIIVHKKQCTQGNCKINLLKNNTISSELLSSIVRKAATLEKESKKKKIK